MAQMVPTEDIMLYCQVTGESGEQLVSSLSDAMEEELLAMGVSPNSYNNERFSLAVKAMTLHELDHPGEARPQGLQSLMNKLKFEALCYG